MLFLASIFVVGVLSGATAAVVGFGIGSLLTPLLLTRFDASVAVVAVAVPHLLATALRLVQHRQFVDRTVLMRFGLASAAGGLTGAWLQGALSDRLLFIVLGGLLLATAIANLIKGGLPAVASAKAGLRPPPAVAMILGLLSGLFGGLVGNQGGLRAAGMLAFNLEPRVYLATGTAVALLIDAARTPVYLLRAGDHLLALALPISVATAGCLIGTIVGEKVLLGMSPEKYRRVVGVAVGALGIWLLARAA